MRITFVTCTFRNVERNSHCDVLHIGVARLFLDCNGDFAIKAYMGSCAEQYGGMTSDTQTHTNKPPRAGVQLQHESYNDQGAGWPSGLGR